MNYPTLQTSRSLSNIPQRKLDESIQALTKACKDCSAKSNLDGLCQKCSVRVVAMNRYYDAGIPIEYWLLSMDDFKGAPELKKAYEFIIGSINDFYDKGTTVCFAGNHGCGKTYTASALLRFVCQKNFSATYTTFADVISSLIDSPFEEKYNSRKQLLMSDFLVLDELDPRHIGKGLAEDLFGRSLDGIFRTRLQNHLPTIIITNSPNVLESFSGSIKESLGSLMSKMKTIVCRGDDYRKAGK